MKLGNGLGASGAYFLKVFLGWAAGCRKLLRSGECVCYARLQVAIFTDLLQVADLLSLTSCVRTYE